MSNSLLISQGTEQPVRFLLTNPEAIIGRDESCDVCVHDIEVSRQHCRITRRNHRFFATDLDSSNGTFVNNKRIEHVKLRSGDLIRVGSTEITFQQEANVVQPSSSSTDAACPSTAATLTAISTQESALPGSRLDEESTYYDMVTDEVEASRRFVQVGNDLRFLYHASMATSYRSDINQMVEEILNLILDWIAADRACVLLEDPSGDDFEIKAFKHRDDLADTNDLHVSKSIVNYVRKQKVGVLSTKAADDQRWGAQPSILKAKIDQVLCVPIQGRDEVLGVIYLDTICNLNGGDEVGFSEDHLRMLIALAHQTAVAIENEAYYEALIEKERATVIGQTTAMIAHHVKNTLQGINGGSHLIESGLKREDLSAIEKGWQIVHRNQELISRFVIDMLIIGRPYEPIRESANLNLAIQEAVDKLRLQFEHHNVECKFESNQEICEFKFEFSRISSAILHVLNCFLHADRDRDSESITISINRRESQAQIIIVGDGSKIDIDEPDETRNPITVGHRKELYMIGAAVSQKIIRAHDGDISFSYSEESGNCFTIEIPMV